MECGNGTDGQGDRTRTNQTVVVKKDSIRAGNPPGGGTALVLKTNPERSGGAFISFAGVHFLSSCRRVSSASSCPGRGMIRGAKTGNGHPFLSLLFHFPSPITKKHHAVKKEGLMPSPPFYIPIGISGIKLNSLDGKSFQYYKRICLLHAHPLKNASSMPISSNASASIF